MEVCVDGAWSAVSEYDWDYSDAQVVCRQLNLPHQCMLYLNICMYVFMLDLTRKKH